MSKYKKVHQAFLDLQAGLERARNFYSEMKDTVESLGKNVQAFVENRKSEGGQLLNAIESAKSAGVGAQADRERDRLKDLMERMSVHPSSTPAMPQQSQTQQNRPSPLQTAPSYNSGYNNTSSPHMPTRYGQTPANGQYGMTSPQQQQPSYAQSTNGSYPGPRRESYNSSSQPYNPGSYGQISPPAHQQYFSPPPNSQYGNYGQAQQQQAVANQYSHNVPQGYVPPPPPGPPPQQDFGSVYGAGGSYPSGPGGYAQDPRRSGQKPNNGDPWAGLNAWK